AATIARGSGLTRPWPSGTIDLVGLSLKSQHLKRYKDVALLLIKYGRRDLVNVAGLDPALDGERAPVAAVDPAAAELADDLERMGPTFIKLGQPLSTRPAMRDGRRVAVKVQRPDIRERVAEDLEALAEIAEFLDEHTEMGRRYEF